MLDESISLPGCIHHRKAAEVATGQCHQNATCRVNVVISKPDRHTSFIRTEVAQHKEWYKDNTSENWNPNVLWSWLCKQMKQNFHPFINPQTLWETPSIICSWFAIRNTLCKNYFAKSMILPMLANLTSLLKVNLTSLLKANLTSLLKANLTALILTNAMANPGHSNEVQFLY